MDFGIHENSFVITSIPRKSYLKTSVPKLQKRSLKSKSRLCIERELSNKRLEEELLKIDNEHEKELLRIKDDYLKKEQELELEKDLIEKQFRALKHREISSGRRRNEEILFFKSLSSEYEERKRKDPYQRVSSWINSIMEPPKSSAVSSTPSKNEEYSIVERSQVDLVTCEVNQSKILDSKSTKCLDAFSNKLETIDLISKDIVLLETPDVSSAILRDIASSSRLSKLSESAPFVNGIDCFVVKDNLGDGADASQDFNFFGKDFLEKLSDPLYHIPSKVLNVIPMPIENRNDLRLVNFNVSCERKCDEHNEVKFDVNFANLTISICGLLNGDGLLQRLLFHVERTFYMSALAAPSLRNNLIFFAWRKILKSYHWNSTGWRGFIYVCKLKHRWRIKYEGRTKIWWSYEFLPVLRYNTLDSPILIDN